jgi:hypothetical protein
MTIIRPPAIRSLTDPGARAGLAGDSPETRRCPSDPRSEVLRRVSGEATARLAPCQQEWAGRVAVGEGPESGLLGKPTWARTSNIQHRTLNVEPRTGSVGLQSVLAQRRAVSLRVLAPSLFNPERRPTFPSRTFGVFGSVRWRASAVECGGWRGTGLTPFWLRLSPAAFWPARDG